VALVHVPPFLPPPCPRLPQGPWDDCSDEELVARLLLAPSASHVSEALDPPHAPAPPHPPDPLRLRASAPPTTSGPPGPSDPPDPPDPPGPPGAATAAAADRTAAPARPDAADHSRTAAARRILERAGPLRRLATRTPGELARLAGLRADEAERLAACFALVRRLLGARMRAGEPFTGPRQIFEHYRAALRDHKREVFLVVLLDARHRVMHEEVISEGSLTSSIVHPREVFLPAVRESAGALVFVHNHPSGDPRPSEEDIAVTRRLGQAAEVVGIPVLDHLVIGDGEYTSFKEAGLL